MRTFNDNETRWSETDNETWWSETDNETIWLKSENMLDSGIELKMLCCMVVITVSEQIGMVFVFASNVKSMKPHDDTFEDFLGILFL